MPFMNLSSPHRIPAVLSSLECLEDLSLRDQSVFLLKRLAYRFPRGKTFWLDALYLPQSYSVPDPHELVPGLPMNERQMAIHYLLDEPWEEIERNGYVTKAPRGLRWYEISAKGWATVDNMTRGFDGDCVTWSLPPAGMADDEEVILEKEQSDPWLDELRRLPIRDRPMPEQRLF
jgi:hypothetical protein